MTNVFLTGFSENLPGINPVVTNYKIRHDKNQPVRYSLAWLDRFSVIVCGDRNTGLDVKGCVEGSHGKELVHCVS